MNDVKEGSGVYYYQNGDREIGDYLNDAKTGKHILIDKSGKVVEKNY